MSFAELFMTGLANRNHIVWRVGIINVPTDVMKLLQQSITIWSINRAAVPVPIDTRGLFFLIRVDSIRLRSLNSIMDFLRNLRF